MVDLGGSSSKIKWSPNNVWFDILVPNDFQELSIETNVGAT